MLYLPDRELVRLERRRYCRRCGASISPHDLVGTSSALCALCRN
jgi:hypothetical protein